MFNDPSDAIESRLIRLEAILLRQESKLDNLTKHLIGKAEALSEIKALAAKHGLKVDVSDNSQNNNKWTPNNNNNNNRYEKPYQKREYQTPHDTKVEKEVKPIESQTKTDQPINL